jgi:hypothetical protein
MASQTTLVLNQWSPGSVGISMELITLSLIFNDVIILDTNADINVDSYEV